MTRYKPHDFYFKKAKRHKFVARSVYKLEEIQKKYHIIKKGAKVLDLGCAPGSWLQLAEKAVGASGLVVGVDQKEITRSFGPTVIFIKADVNKLDTNILKKYTPEYDVVLSDMAPATTGIGFVDSVRSIQLADQAFEIALFALKERGTFLCKVFEGEDFPPFLKKVKREFDWVKIIKPKASRKKSREIYLLATGKRTGPHEKKQDSFSGP